MQADVAGVKVVADAGLDYLRGIARRKHDLMRNDMARMRLPALRRVISMGVVRITLAHFCPSHQDARSQGFGRIEIRAVAQYLRAPAIVSLAGRPVRPFWWTNSIALPERFEEIVLDVRRNEGDPVAPSMSSSQALPGDPSLAPPPASGAAVALKPMTAIWAGWGSVSYDGRLSLLKRAVQSGLLALSSALARQMLGDFSLRNGLAVVFQMRALWPINGDDIFWQWQDVADDAYTVLAVDLDSAGEVWVMLSYGLYTSGHPLPSGQPQPNPAVAVLNLSRIGSLSEQNWTADEVAAARGNPGYKLRFPLDSDYGQTPWIDVDGVAVLCPPVSAPGAPRDPEALDQANLWRELSRPSTAPDAANVAMQWIWWIDNLDGMQGYAFFGLGGSRFFQARVEFDPLPAAWWRTLSFDWRTHQFTEVAREDFAWMHSQMSPSLDFPPELVAAEAMVRHAFASSFGSVARGLPPVYPPGSSFQYAGKEHVVRPAERGSAGHYRHWRLAGEGARLYQHVQDHEGWWWEGDDSRAYPVYRLLWRGEAADVEPIVLDEVLGFSDVEPTSLLILSTTDDAQNGRTLMTFIPPLSSMNALLDSGQGAAAGSHCGATSAGGIPCFWPTETDVPWYSRRHAGLVDCAAPGRSLCIVRYSWLWEVVLRAAMIPVLYQEPEEARGNLWPLVPGRRSELLDQLDAHAAGNWNPFGLVGVERQQFDNDYGVARIRLAEFAGEYEPLYADYLAQKDDYEYWRDLFANDNGNEVARSEMEAARTRLRASQAAMSEALIGFVRRFRRVLVNNCLTDQIIDWLEPGNAYFMY